MSDTGPGLPAQDNRAPVQAVPGQHTPRGHRAWPGDRARTGPMPMAAELAPGLQHHQPAPNSAISLPINRCARGRGIIQLKDRAVSPLALRLHRGAARYRAPAHGPARAPIAQLDRAPDYESGGRGFESSPVRHSNTLKLLILNANLVWEAWRVSHNLPHTIIRSGSFVFNRRVPRAVQADFGCEYVRIKLGRDEHKAGMLAEKLTRPCGRI